MAVQVEPLLEVLVGKCLEQGLMEVMEEEELAAMRAHQQHYEQVCGRTGSAVHYPAQLSRGGTGKRSFESVPEVAKSLHCQALIACSTVYVCVPLSVGSTYPGMEMETFMCLLS